MTTERAALYRARQAYRDFQMASSNAYQVYNRIATQALQTATVSNTVYAATTTTAATWVTQPTPTSTTPQWVSIPPNAMPSWPDHIALDDGRSHIIEFPDGTMIYLAANGNFTVNDKDSKVIYRGNRIREFNPFLNASDKLEAFIKFCGAVGVRQGDVLDIPIKLFIGWLIIEAARADGEHKDSDIDLLDGIHKHVKRRCVGCGRFLARKAKANICRAVCLEAA